MFFVCATFVPEAMQMLVGGFFVLFDALWNAAMQGNDVVVADHLWAQISTLTAAIFLAPVIVVAILSELFGWRSATVQAGATGLLTVLFPLAMLGVNRALTAGETRLVAALFVTGAVAGWIYWLVAGAETRPDTRDLAPRPPA